MYGEYITSDDPGETNMARRKAIIGFAARYSCVVALIPMLLWPCFVRANCCCSGRQLQVELSGCHVADAQTTEGDEAAGRATTRLTCPRCCAATAIDHAQAILPTEESHEPAASWLARCDCQLQSPAAPLPERVELKRSSVNTLCDTFDSTLGEWLEAHASICLSPVFGAGFYPTSTQRRALLCCWLI